MRDQERLEEALQLLRATDREASAPAALESRLRSAYRAHHVQPRRRWKAAAAFFAAAAATVVLGAFWYTQTPRSAGDEKVAGSHPRNPENGFVSQPQARESKPSIGFVSSGKSKKQKPSIGFVSSQRASQKQFSRRAKPQAAGSELQSAQVVKSSEPVDERAFTPIPYAPPFTESDRGQVLRVRLPGASIRSLGVPVGPERLFERVPADVLMGEDGIPRAIRVVNR